MRLEKSNVSAGVVLTINAPLIAGLYRRPKKKKKLNPNKHTTPTSLSPFIFFKI